jgi:hypothetical protein
MSREEYEPDALDASDEAARDLLEGRYSNLVVSKPAAKRMALKAAEILTPGKHGYLTHLRGYTCKTCGSDILNPKAATIHNDFHDWLDELVERLGEDADRFEGELEQLREHLDEKFDEATRRAARAEAQVDVMISLLRPLIERGTAVEDQEEEPSVHKATA